MKLDLFDFDQYKTYLNHFIKSLPGKGRGYKSQLSRAAKCQLAYLTRVLHGDAHLSLEQAQAISIFMGHGEDENHLFVLLVQRARAGTKALKEYFDAQILQVKEKRHILKERFKVKGSLSSEDQAIYYSHWIYAVIHVIVSVPSFQTRESISQHLGLPLGTIVKALEFLIACGLVVQQGDRFKMGVTRIHLGSDSPFVIKHHTNWRLQAVRSLDDAAETRTDDLHYSSIVSLSKEDSVKIKNLLINKVEEFNSVVRDSREEEVRCLCLDFFLIGSNQK